MTTNESTIEVGVLSTPYIHFKLNGIYQETTTGQIFKGIFHAYKDGTNLTIQQDEFRITIHDGFTLYPTNYEQCSFEIQDVTIGKNFHWEQKENQTFKGALKIIEEDKHLTAVNIIQLEDYLISVISSEMNAQSSLELLKAHAIISRSWLIAQKTKTPHKKKKLQTHIQTRNQYIRWFDQEDHKRFDVCADDHCQRYQGITKAITPTVTEAVLLTRGQILTYDNEICDARFSKCCGGITEQFDNVWDAIDHPYLHRIEDSEKPLPPLDLRNEEAAKTWILSSPEVFCNLNDPQIKTKILNEYDLATSDFFRWQISYSAEELSELVRKKLNINFGYIKEIRPVERGVSGRLIKVKIIGSIRSMTIGKELIIRQAFSPTHLYSSAFIIETEKNKGRAIRFTFKGAGWGHGVGLCQIGAAVMSEKGYNYKQILQHYFPGTELKQIKDVLLHPLH